MRCLPVILLAHGIDDCYPQTLNAATVYARGTLFASASALGVAGNSGFVIDKRIDIIEHDPSNPKSSRVYPPIVGQIGRSAKRIRHSPANLI